MLRDIELKPAPIALALTIAACMVGWLWAIGLRPNSLWMRILTVVTMAGMGLVVIAFAIQNLLHARTLLNQAVPQRTSYLVTEGVYSWSRNPMYLGLLMLLLAIARAFDSFAQYLGPLLFFVLVDRLQIPAEERALSKAFGDEYSTYMSKVRRWL
jgi:protein-S-isoprenylcysteine O-methyltransferase Ste14